MPAAPVAPVWAVDTEDDSAGQVHLVNWYDGHRHVTFERMADESCATFRLRVWNWLYARAPEPSARVPGLHVWACNAEYDLVNLFGPWLGKMMTLQYVSSGLLRASCRDVKVTVFDTLRHWPMSVEQMGLYLGLPKLEADFHSVAYCRRDTEIVWRFVTHMLARYAALELTVKATLPAMALQLFATRFHPAPFVALPPSLVTWFRRGYYGGRVEVYRFGTIAGPIRHYDVNSLFPSVMADGTYPDLATVRQTRTPRWDQEGMATCTLTLPATAYPALPMRGARDLLYPYGRLHGTWCYPEIRQALTDGAQVAQVHEAWECAPRVSPFSGYVAYCYAQRQRATHDLDNVLWKLMMNALYGKFGQKPGLEMIYDDRAFTLETAPTPTANVVWAAYVTSLARVRLLAFLRACSTCYYTDTDSLFTPDVLPVSRQLGALKQEGVYARMEAKGNKLYAVDAADGTSRYRAKGVPRGAAKDFFRTGRAVFRKPIRFRESRRMGVAANVWVMMEKRRVATYTKRIVQADGGTVPWEWSQYQRAMR